MNRRTMLKTTGMAGVVAMAGGVLTACNPKNLSVYVQTIVGALEEVAPLLPNSAAIITKAVKVARDFDEAYRAGKFVDAVTLFENLDGFIRQIFADTGIGNNDTVKIALAVTGIALRAIAVLLKSQESEPAVAAVVARTSAPGAPARRSLIDRLASPAAVNEAFAVAKP